LSTDLIYICGLCNYDSRSPISRCPICGAPMEIHVKRLWSVDKGIPSMWRYGSMLPKPRSIVSLGEGFTPIRRIGGVVIKDETRNPTRSYIDRGSSMVASFLDTKTASLEYIPDVSISLTAYLTSKGIDISVYISTPITSSSEIIEISRLGGQIVFESTKPDIRYIGYDNPYMLEGFKTISYEIYEQLGDAKCISIPAEEGLLAYSVARGFAILEELGLAEMPGIIVTTSIHRQRLGLQDLLMRIKNVRLERVDDQSIVDAIVELSSRGLYIRPISSTSYAISRRHRECVAIITGSEIKRLAIRGSSMAGSRYIARTSELQRRVLDILSRSVGELTAYEIWRRLGNRASLRGVYTAVEDLSRRGFIDVVIETRGARKVRLYRVRTI